MDYLRWVLISINSFFEIRRSNLYDQRTVCVSESIWIVGELKPEKSQRPKHGQSQITFNALSTRFYKEI